MAGFTVSKERYDNTPEGRAAVIARLRAALGRGVTTIEVWGVDSPFGDGEEPAGLSEIIHAPGLRVDAGFIEEVATGEGWGFSRLSGLVLKVVRLDDEAATVLARKLAQCDSLREVNLSSNRIGKAGCADLAKALKGKNALREVNLSSNRIGEAGCADLAKALKGKNALRDVNLSSNNIGEAGCADLAVTLRGKNALRDVKLGGNNVRDSGCAALAGALEGKNALRYVEVSNNSIGEVGCAALAGALKGKNALRHLILSGNDIGDSGCAALAAALKGKDALQNVVLWNNSIRDAGAEALVRSVGPSAPEVRLWLSGNPITIFPAELLASPPARVLLDVLERGVPLAQAKLVLLGRGGAGKTSLGHVLRGLRPPERYDPTEGFERHLVARELPIDGLSDARTCTVRMVDFAGQQLVTPTHRLFLTSRAVYVIVVDATMPAEGDTEEEGNRLSHWFELACSQAPGAPVVVVVNKMGRLDSPSRTPEQWTELVASAAKRVGITPAGVLTGVCLSPKTLQSDEEAGKYARKRLWPALDEALASISTLSQRVPPKALELQRALEGDAHDDFPLKPEVGLELVTDFLARCDRFGVYPGDTASQLAMLRLTHELGTVFCWDQRVLTESRDDGRRARPPRRSAHLNELDDVVFHPGWLCKRVYRVVEHRSRHAPIISRADAYTELLDLDPRSSERHARLILAAMQQCELIVALEGRPDAFLYPRWLAARPVLSGSWEGADEWGTKGTLVLPDDFVARLICRLHRYDLFRSTLDASGEVSCAWRHGVIGADPMTPGVDARVVASTNPGGVRVQVRGGTAEARRELWSTIKRMIHGVVTRDRDRADESVVWEAVRAAGTDTARESGVSDGAGNGGAKESKPLGAGPSRLLKVLKELGEANLKSVEFFKHHPDELCTRVSKADGRVRKLMPVLEPETIKKYLRELAKHPDVLDPD
jgi:hypothetical protein